MYSFVRVVRGVTSVERPVGVEQSFRTLAPRVSRRRRGSATGNIGVRPAAEMSLTTPLTRLVREAVDSLAEPHWHVRGVGALRRHDNGYWAQIVFAGANRKEEPLAVGLTAELSRPTCSRRQHEDPDKPPRATLVAAHASVVWDQRVTFDEEEPRRIRRGSRCRIDRSPGRSSSASMMARRG